MIKSKFASTGIPHHGDQEEGVMDHVTPGVRSCQYIDEGIGKERGKIKHLHWRKLRGRATRGRPSEVGSTAGRPLIVSMA